MNSSLPGPVAVILLLLLIQAYKRKYVHLVLVNQLVLSLPRKSVVRLTDRHSTIQVTDDIMTKINQLGFSLDLIPLKKSMTDHSLNDNGGEKPVFKPL